ncbi:hypothetical protein FOMA001_g11869 [Fusarium oxysporum f. sp. matthiolae]|nr:hypothetical protein FOMA001_g11869 [Fusarium oxysporum f. sp. matthiolae]
MTWLSKNTTIPLPEVIAYDDSPITRSAHPWGGIGGLTLDDQGEVQLGTVVDETFWQVPDIEALWPEGETVASLNIGGSYKTYVEYMVAHVNKYIRLIQIHEKLAFMRDTIPRLEAFVAALHKHADKLNNVKLRLAHKDLHFTNMISDPLPGKITGILDRDSFLWNRTYTPESLDEEYRSLEVFKQRSKEKGCKLFEETEYTSPLQEDMQRAVDFLRAIVEVSPRGQRQELVQGWKDMVLENIAKFGA